MPKMGVEKLYVSKLLTDASSGMTFSTPQYYSGIQEISLKPKVNSASAYAENRKVDQDTMFDSCDISMSLFAMTSTQRAFMLGQSLASTGGSIGSLNDSAPFIAVLYKAPIKVNGVKGYRYGVIYKIMFEPPDDDYKGLEGKPDFSQVDKMSGSAQPTEWSFIDNGIEKHPWEYHVDTTDANCPDNIDTTWFKNIPVPSLSSYNNLEITSSAPVNNDTGSALTEKPTITFNNAITDYSNVLLYNVTDGSLVDISKTLDDTGKVLTITPSASLVAGKAYNVIVQGVTDTFGQTLVTQLIKFTTVSGS